MRFSTSIAVALSAIRTSACPTGPSPVDGFLETQGAIALEQILCNIGADGCRAAGVKPGLAIASPSKTEPPYFFTWTRDSSLVFKTLIEHFAVNDYDPALQKKIQEFIVAQAELQGVSNPSGILADGSGLGEPKFNVDITQFTGAWGRPQHDGPPLRAIAMIGYAKWLAANGYAQTAQEMVWPVIRNDLYYTAEYWNQTGYDLWEEVTGASFFTTISQYRALVEGNTLAAALQTTCEACEEVAPHVLCFLQSYWSDDGHVISNFPPSVESTGKQTRDSPGPPSLNRTGKDGNSILGSVHSFDPALGCDALTFQPCSDRALANHKSVTDSFRDWPINANSPAGSAVAVGRYVEDVYYDGNPWYLITLAAAEQLYDALAVWSEQGFLDVTDVSLPFFADLVPSVSVGTYKKGTAGYKAIVKAVSAYADGYVSIVETYVPSDGSMTEQFDKATGKPLGAPDLTWSYASFVAAAAARKGVRSPDFGWLASPPELPASCAAPSVEGAYISATSVSFPASQTPGGDETITSSIPEPTSTVCLSKVTFNALVESVWGDSIMVVGDIPELGNGDPAQGKPLSAEAYTDDNPLWRYTVSVEAGTSFTYNFVKITEDGEVTWEAGPKRSYSASEECRSSGETGGEWQ